MTRKDDVLPGRLMEPLTEGSFIGESISKHTLDEMLDQYYTMRGWDCKTGWPTKETLEKLELSFLSKEIE